MESVHSLDKSWRALREKLESSPWRFYSKGLHQIHRDPAIFGDWAPHAYRKLRGYCYVVIETNCRFEKFEKLRY